MVKNVQKLARVLYLSWIWLVFFPAVFINTVFWGMLAMLVAPFSHRFAFHFGTIWGRILCWANWTRVDVMGRDKVSPGQAYVIMMNHQSHFDILAFYGHWGRQFRWVMKEELRKMPFLGWGCVALRNVFVDRTDRAKAIASLRAARPLFDQGISVLIFPEGTRGHEDRMRDFKKGGFMMALDMGLPILPVTIRGTREIVPTGSLRVCPGRVQITVHEPVETSGMDPSDRDRLMETVRTVIESGFDRQR